MLHSSKYYSIILDTTPDISDNGQQKILEINSLAYFVPYAAHSLNLVVNDAAKISFEAVNFLVDSRTI